MQGQFSPSQLQSLIEKYQRELMDSYKRQAAKSGNMQAEEKPEPKEKARESTNDLNKPAYDKPTFDNPTVPEGLKTQAVETALSEIEDNSSVVQNDFQAEPASFTRQAENFAEDDCPVAPSMLRPRVEDSVMDVDAAVESSDFDMGDEFPASPSMFRSNSLYDSQPRVKPVMLEDDCPPSPSVFRPYRVDKRAVMADMPKPDTSKPANLQVKVTTGRQMIPVNGARVTVTRNGVSTQKIHKVTNTDRTGCTPVISIPNCGPPAPFTIEVTANGFCSARYSGVPLYSGMTSIKHVDLIPLPSGEKSDLMILFDDQRK